MLHEDMIDAFDPRLVFRFGPVEFRVGPRELLVAGVARDIEIKPLDLLHELLQHRGEVVTQQHLIATVWKGQIASKSAVMSAVSKLRIAIGDSEGDTIVSVRGIGYRFMSRVEVTTSAEAPKLSPSLRPGEHVPGLPAWRLARPLGGSRARDVWLAEDAAGARHVFKFAYSAQRLDSLKRELAISHVLRDTLGARPDFVAVVGSNFKVLPFFIESEYGGPDLCAWAARFEELGACPLSVRVAMVARAARTVAAAHAAGCLHSDIKPANILIGDNADAAPLVRLVDFGAGGVTDAARARLMATISFGSMTGADADRRAGSLHYLAPELEKPGALPTTGADVFALGVLLYQMAAGDLERGLTPGWEADIADSLLRRDISDSVARNPAARLASAAALAERLENLETRRDAQRAEAAAAARAAWLARKLERDRMRRPWIIAAGLSLAACLVVAIGLGAQTARERDEARRQTALARSINSFLTEDLIGRGNPAVSGRSSETLIDAATRAQAGIDRRFGGAPLIAGSIYLSLADAFAGRSAFPEARNAFDHAIAWYEKAGKAGAADATIARLMSAPVDMVSGTPDAMARARLFVAISEKRIPRLGARRLEAEVWLARAKAMLEVQGGDMRAAEKQFRVAAAAADRLGGVFDDTARFGMHLNEASALFRIGQLGAADTILRDLLTREMALHGPHNPQTLNTEMTMALVAESRGEQARALAMLNRIYPEFITVYGKTHGFTLKLLEARAMALGQLEDYRSAISDDLNVYEVSVKQQGEHAFMPLVALMDMSTWQCRGGEVKDGTASARRAYATARESFGAGNALTQAGAFDLAFCLIVQRQYDQAAPLLTSIDAQAVGALAADPSFGPELDLMRAQVALGKGNVAREQALLRAVTPAFQAPGVDPYMRKWLLRLTANSLANPVVERR